MVHAYIVLNRHDTQLSHYHLPQYPTQSHPNT